MYYTIYKTTTDSFTVPSLRYIPMGYLNEHDALLLEDKLQGSPARIVAFKTRDKFGAYVDQKDKKFWEEHCCSSNIIESKDLTGLPIHLN